MEKYSTEQLTTMLAQIKEELLKRDDAEAYLKHEAAFDKWVTNAATAYTSVREARTEFITKHKLTIPLHTFSGMFQRHYTLMSYRHKQGVGKEYKKNY